MFKLRQSSEFIGNQPTLKPNIKRIGIAGNKEVKYEYNIRYE